jgi:hypothetical protein
MKIVKDREKKLNRIFSKPECCEGCMYCIQEQYRYFCTPIKEKHGYTNVSPNDLPKENECCRFKY